MVIEYMKWIPIVSLGYTTLFVILCHLSFSWKDDKKKIIFAVLVMGLLPIIPIMYQYPYRMFLVMITDLIWMKIIFRKKMKDIVVPYYTAFALGIPVDMVVWTIFTKYLSITPFEASYLVLIAQCVAFLMAMFIVCRILPIRKYYQTYRPVIERYFPILLIFVLVIMFLNALMYVTNYAIDFTHSLLIGLLLIVIIYSFLQVLSEDREEKNLMRNYQQQKSLAVPLIEEIRSKQHDFKNHLTTIYGFSQKNDSDLRQNIQSYIESLNQHLKDIDIFLHIKNKVISSILYSKLCEADSRDIDLHYEIPPYEVPVPLVDYEYVAVMGNILDNAFEAPMQSEGEKKKIILKLTHEDGSSVLEIWNNGIPISSKEMSSLFRKGYSTKESKSLRGYGLYNVKRIVDKYNGKIEILRQNDLTGFRICFPSS